MLANSVLQYWSSLRPPYIQENKENYFCSHIKHIFINSMDFNLLKSLIKTFVPPHIYKKDGKIMK